MPIGIDRFEDANDLGEPTTSERIVRFLFAHDDRAFTRREIADAVDANPETVGTNLTRLKDRDLVRHREPYWALTDNRERAIDALRSYEGDTRRPESGGGTAGVERRDHGTPPEESERTDEHGTETASAASTSPGPHREAAVAFFERVRDHHGEAVDALYLFGSVARGDETPTSDVDVLAVVADDSHYASVDDRLLDIAYDVQLEYGVPVEVHSIRASEFAARDRRGEPFVRTAIEEGEVDA